MKPAPIRLTAAATDFITRALGAPHSDTDAALLWSPHRRGENGLYGYEGPAVWIGWYPKGRRVPDSFYELCGHAVSISADTLQHIEGKTVDFERFPTGFANGPPTYTVLKVITAAGR